jgi:thiamine pyrophosphate-dependent acetolactate synthase large subunit-like protein
LKDGGRLVAETLRTHGVDVVFSLCGDHTNAIFEGCAAEGVRIVDARDERGAAWMACGYALSTGRAGVVLVTGGPGLTNAVTALADAQTSGVPLVCITGGVGLSQRGLGHPGDIDQIALVRPVSKWAATVERPGDAGETIAAAFGVARGGRPGVAVVEIPVDVQLMETDAAAPEPLPSDPPPPDPDQIAAARAALAAARRPIAIAGSGCFWAGAATELAAFIERVRVPLFTIRGGRGLVPDDHELCFGFPNFLAGPAQIAFGEADCVIVLGTKLDLMLAGGAFNPDARVVRVDADPTALSLGRRADVEVVADARFVLAALTEGFGTLPTEEWLARLSAARDAQRATLDERAGYSGDPIHPARLVAELAAALPVDAIVCVDAGELALWAVEALPAWRPGSQMLSLGSAMGALGMGVPWAIGAKVAHPDRPVVVLAGDGSFGFSAMELDTAARHGLPVAVVVGNDGGWGIVRHMQQLVHGRPVASDLPGTAYEKLAEMAGGHGERIERAPELELAFSNAFASKMPVVLNVMVDQAPMHDACRMIALMFSRPPEAG